MSNIISYAVLGAAILMGTGLMGCGRISGNYSGTVTYNQMAAYGGYGSGAIASQVSGTIQENGGNLTGSLYGSSSTGAMHQIQIVSGQCNGGSANVSVSFTQTSNNPYGTGTLPGSAGGYPAQPGATAPTVVATSCSASTFTGILTCNNNKLTGMLMNQQVAQTQGGMMGMPCSGSIQVDITRNN